MLAGCFALGLSLYFPAHEAEGQPAFDHAFLAGLGASVDLHPRVSAYALAVGGDYSVLLRDYISGTWRGTSFAWYSTGHWSWAWGGTLGVAVRPLTLRDGAFSVPVLGAAVTGLRVPPGADRLRGVSWGGWQPVFTVSLGVELAVRRTAPSAPPPPPVQRVGLRPSPELHAAAAQGRWREVKSLLAQDADPNAPDPQGATALHLACAAASNEATVWQLLARGADVRAVDASGATPLHWAASSRRLDAVRLLLQGGADANARAGQAAHTPLHAAAAANALGCVELLLQHGADLAARDAWGRTPLEVAQAGGHVEVAERLLRADGSRRSPR